MPAARSVRGNKTPRTLHEHLEELKKDGKTVVPCPHGHGWYQVSLAGSHWYHTPEIIFSASDKCPYPFDDPNYAGSSFRVSEGRVIAWFPKWNGLPTLRERAMLGGPVKKRITQKEHMFRLAKMIIMIILSGRKLYSLRCGESISSMDAKKGSLSKTY